MKEPTAPQVYYDGSLKELASAHVGLVKAVLFIFVLPIPLLLLGIFMDTIRYSGYPEIKSAFLYAFYGSILIAIGWIFWRCARLARILFPHVAMVLAACAIIPPLSLGVAFFLWFCALRQLRARGLHVGVLGIDSARVE